MFLNKKKLPMLVKKQAAMPLPGALKKKFLPQGAISAVKDPNEGIIPKPPPIAPPAAPTTPTGDMDVGAMLEQAAQAAEASADPELEDLLVDYMNGDMTQPPAWATDPEMWNKAAQTVGLGQGDTELAYDEPFVVAAYLYKMMGGPTTPVELPMDPMGEPAPEGPPPAPAAKPPMARPAAKPMQKPGVPPAKPGAPAPAKPGMKPAAKPPPKGDGTDGVSSGQVRSTAGKLAMAKGGMGAKPPAPAAPGKGVGNPALKKPPMHGEAGEGAHPEGQEGDVVEQAAQEAATNPDPELAERLQNYDPERDGNPPEWAADPDIWSQAESAVKPKWDEYDEPYAVVAHVYKKMGGTVQ